MNYPNTKEEWQQMLDEIEGKLRDQGGIVDARLLDKARMIKKLIQEWDWVGNNQGNSPMRNHGVFFCLWPDMGNIELAYE